MLDKLLVSRRLNKSRALQETLEDIFTCKYTPNVWKHFLAEARLRTNIPDGKEWSILLSMLHERHLVHGDYFDFVIDEESVTDRVFIMSRDQIWNCQRNGVVLCMDTTMKSNRFGLPLTFVCGIDEYQHTMILAIAFTLHQDADSFRWIFNNMARAVGDKAWGEVRSITTDGDKAMISAIAICLPKSAPMRCVFHLRMNIKARLMKEKLEPAQISEISLQWYLIASRDYTPAQYAALRRCREAVASLPPRHC
jgi:hypothetical protein